MIKLYSYWRSSSSFRVRVALNLKGIPYETVPVNLLKGEHRTKTYLKVNPAAGVPTIQLDDGRVLTQSLAILNWLEATNPNPPLLPDNPEDAAQVEAAAHVFTSEVHPVNNLRVTKYLRSEFGADDRQVRVWMHHWMQEGFATFQQMIAPDGRFCFGDAPNLADICLVGQMLNATRWGCDLAPFGRLVEIDAACRSLDPFRKAMPEFQPDALTD